MRTKENFKPYIITVLSLTLATLLVSQLYIWREPSRIQRDEQSDLLAARTAGGLLYGENCASCHGMNGEGGVGPALNDRGLLAIVFDEMLFSLTRTGVPGTRMPAWSQDFGGPFTDEQIAQIVAFIRAWEPTAPLIEAQAEVPDAQRGALIYEQTCFICHGENGLGTAVAPALNDPERLQKLDDAWYRATIGRGRPAKGMPTWGTVLSPAEINDVVALIAAWREGESVRAKIPLATFVTNALFAIRQFDRPDAAFFLRNALSLVEGDQADEMQAILSLIEENQLYEAQARLIALLPPAEMGRAAFDTNCAPCHGDDGGGGMGPNLHINSFVKSKDDSELFEFILEGRRNTPMDGFDGILGEDEINNLIVLMREWQE